jgi:lipopolysaccharide/colanic/teichoic acid biosynthesis glycosyltransferase
MAEKSEALRARNSDAWRMAAKRIIDVLVSAIGRALLSPIFAAIWGIVFPSARNPLADKSISDRFESLGAAIGFDDAP